MDVALSIRSCALGSYNLVQSLKQIIAVRSVCPNTQCPIANDQFLKQPFSNYVIYIVSVLSTVSCLALKRGIQILESEKFLHVESGIVGIEIWNTAQGIRNLNSTDKVRNPDSTA